MLRTQLIALCLLALVFTGDAFAQPENDGSTCELPGVSECRALETAVIGPRLDGQPITSGLVTVPSSYFDGNDLYMSAHALFWPDWSPPGLNVCMTSNGLRKETRALWVKESVNASNIKQSFDFVRRISPCNTDINGEIDSSRGEEHGGGEGEIENGFNGLYYTFASTFFDTLPSNPTLQCTDWDEACFPGIYVGASNVAGNFPLYMKTRLLSIYTYNGVQRGFHIMRLAPFNAPGVPGPPSSVFPPQVHNGSGPLFFGYVSWGAVPGSPTRVARVQIVDAPDGRIRPHWGQTRIFMVDNTGTWRLVPIGGKPNFVPETLVDTTGNGDFEGPSSPFYDPAYPSADRWRIAVHRDFVPTGVTGCNEASRLSGSWFGKDQGSSTVAHRSIGSTHSVVLPYSTATTNGAHFGLEIFQIPGSNQWYAARGSTERICFGTENWFHPFVGSEITIEKLP